MKDDAALLEHIARLPHARATFKQLVRELGARGDGREELEAALDRLTARGELLEARSGQYSVTSRSRDFAVGRLQMHRDGYGFLIADRPIEGIAGTSLYRPSLPVRLCMATGCWCGLHASKPAGARMAKSSKC
jgi:ribonuclease R